MVHPAATAAAADGSSEGAEGGTQWAELVILQAAAATGYRAPALTLAEADTTLRALMDSVEEERLGTCGAMHHLLHSVLTPVQAARYLLAAHPCAWDGLAFAHAVHHAVHGG
jgi:hypothetical protein